MPTASILDAIHPTLPPELWENPGAPAPSLKPEHASFIRKKIGSVLDAGGYTDSASWLHLVLTGSLTTHQYGDSSDVDISLFVNSEMLPEWSRAEMIGLMVHHSDGTILPGTPYPLQCFVVAAHVKEQDLYRPGLRSGYDIDQMQWIVPPDPNRDHDVQSQENGFYVYALETADKMERLIRYEPDKAVQMWHALHRRRRDDQVKGKGDFSESNIIYKFLAKRGLFDQLSQLTGEHIAATKVSEDMSHQVLEGTSTQNPQDPNRAVMWVQNTKKILRGPPGSTQQDLIKDFDPLLRHATDMWRDQFQAGKRWVKTPPVAYGTQTPEGVEWYGTHSYPGQGRWDSGVNMGFHPESEAIHQALGVPPKPWRGTEPTERACIDCGGSGWQPGNRYHDGERGCGQDEDTAPGYQGGYGYTYKGYGCQGTGMAGGDPFKAMGWTHEMAPDQRSSSYVPITQDEARGNSRPVSPEEFEQLAAEGQQRLHELASTPQPTTGLDANWDAIKNDAYQRVQEPWGGGTWHAPSGQPIESNADLYALSARTPDVPAISVPIGSSPKMFHRAMDMARYHYGPLLERQGHHLGVFHDADEGRIDIDPTLVVDNPHDVETIGAHTHAVGGAYHFRTGDGYFPPHVRESEPLAA